MRIHLAVAFLGLVCTAGGCGASSSAGATDAGAGEGGVGSSGGGGSDAAVGDDAAGPGTDGSVPRDGGGTPSGDGSVVPTGDGAVGAGSLQTKTYESREVLVYVPASYVKGTAAPLVLMLHGCTQNPADFVAGTAMDAQADLGGFLVAYPAEPASANTEECWNWFLTADQARASGEPQLLANIVTDVGKDFTVDPKRVFAAGLSAGGAMAVILGATYPDVFAAVASHSGLEYAAGTDATSGLTASAGGGPNPKTQGDLAFAAMGAHARAVPVIVFQGDSDNVVNVANGQQIASQWVETDTRASATVGAGTSTMGSAGGKSFTQTTYAGGSGGKSLIELYVVHGLAHAWSGGSSAGSFTDSAAPPASALIWQFFATRGQ